MSKRIVTISREFGSGGHSIAQAAAQLLGAPCYDKELVKQVALESGFDPAYVEEQGEYAADRFAFLPAGNAPDAMHGLSAGDYLWCIQRQVILQLAEKEPCVIVGRCADFILRDRADALHVFIHADPDYRAERIVRLYGETEKPPQQRLRDKDKKRRNNYRRYTGREWGAARNYHLCLNSAVIGPERCAELIVRLAGETGQEAPGGL